MGVASGVLLETPGHCQVPGGVIGHSTQLPALPAFHFHVRHVVGLCGGGHPTGYRIPITDVEYKVSVAQGLSSGALDPVLLPPL